MNDTERKIFASAGCAYLFSYAAELARNQREKGLLNEQSEVFINKLIDLGANLRDTLVEMGIRLTMQTLNHVDSLGYYRGLTIRGELARDFSRERPSFHDQTVATKMSAVQIFELAKPSVWKLISLSVKSGRPDWEGASQGTAVAISTHTLLTNCHTLVGRSMYLIIQPNSEHMTAVQIKSADHESDRCVLETVDVLPAHVNVRNSTGIEVGEEAYSIGSPSGVDLTIANGLVSGKRIINGILYLQTTAPISKGSSGGGLFDHMGQLIGITTFYVDGGKNLNFAIAADQF